MSLLPLRLQGLIGSLIFRPGTLSPSPGSIYLLNEVGDFVVIWTEKLLNRNSNSVLDRRNGN